VIEARVREGERSSAEGPHLAFRGVTKRYGDVVANDHIDLEIAPGSIHAVVGENGAGKSTLMGVAYGLVVPDRGRVEIGGEEVRLRGPHDAIRHGVGMIQQRLQLLEDLTALENLVLGREPAHGPFLDREAALREARHLAEGLKARIRWDAPVRSLSVGQRQRLEILRLLYRDARLLILDEPTTVLTPQEVDDLFEVLRRLRDRGRTIVFVSHKLREVEALADTVTVMRGGRVVETIDRSQLDLGRVAELMVGDRRFASLAVEGAAGHELASAEDRDLDRTCLEVRDLGVRSPWGSWALEGVDLEVHGGQVLGIAGVEGNGQRELVEAVVGLRPADVGSIRLLGRDVTRADVRGRRERGLAFVSDDRDREGANLDGSITDSAISLEYRGPQLSRWAVLMPGRVRRFVEGLLQRFGVRATRPDAPVRSLSGGNVQRLVLGRELEQAPRLLVAAQPSRGLDIRAVAFVYEQLDRMRGEGTGILLVSEDLDELLSLSDRLAVLYDGRVVGWLERSEFEDRARIGRLIAGAEWG
jgi:general nucleoside transport system ATP-binding protein